MALFHLDTVYVIPVHVQVEQMYYTISSELRHQSLLKILRSTQTQTTAVSLLQLTVIGSFYGAQINSVSSVSQVRSVLHDVVMYLGS